MATIANVEFVEDRVLNFVASNESADSFGPTIKIAGAVNHSKAFGIVQVFVAGALSSHAYVAPSVQAVNTAMDEIQSGLMVSLAQRS